MADPEVRNTYCISSDEQNFARVIAMLQSKTGFEREKIREQLCSLLQRGKVLRLIEHKVKGNWEIAMLGFVDRKDVPGNTEWN